MGAETPTNFLLLGRLFGAILRAFRRSFGEQCGRPSRGDRQAQGLWSSGARGALRNNPLLPADCGPGGSSRWRLWRQFPGFSSPGICADHSPKSPVVKWTQERPGIGGGGLAGRQRGTKICEVFHKPSCLVTPSSRFGRMSAVVNRVAPTLNPPILLMAGPLTNSRRNPEVRDEEPGRRRESAAEGPFSSRRGFRCSCYYKLSYMANGSSVFKKTLDIIRVLGTLVLV